MVQLLWEESFQFLAKLIILLPYDQAMVFFGIYPKELNSYIYTKTCTWIFRAVLFRVAKLRITEQQLDLRCSPDHSKGISLPGGFSIEIKQDDMKVQRR